MPIRVGLRGEASVTVDNSNIASKVGSGAFNVFATPSLVALVERAAVNCLRPHLEVGQESVGVAVSMRHLAATPLGKRVLATAIVEAVEGRRVVFRVEASDSVEKVGEGTHERLLVDRESFIWKVAAKGS